MTTKTHFKIVTQEATESDNQEWGISACGREEFELGTDNIRFVTCKKCIKQLSRQQQQDLKGEGMVERTDKEVIDQTNMLAREFYLIRGYTVAEGYRFDKATHPHERQCWAMACFAQQELTGTDPEDAITNAEDE